MTVPTQAHVLSPCHQVDVLLIKKVLLYKEFLRFQAVTRIWPQKTHYEGFKDKQIRNLLKPYTPKMEK